MIPAADPPKPKWPALKYLRAAKLMSAMHLADEFLGMDRMGIQLVYQQDPPAAEGDPLPSRRIVFRNILLPPRLIHAWR